MKVATILLTGLVPAALILVDTFLLRPLNWGRGLVGGWELLAPIGPQIVAATAWAVTVGVGLVLLTLRARDMPWWRIVRRSAVALAVVMWAGYVLVLMFMQISIDYVDVAQPERHTLVSGVVLRLLTYLSVVVGILALLSYPVEAVAKARGSRVR